MKTFRFDDKLTIPSTRRIQDTGQMIAEGAIARVGILSYRAKDLAGLFGDRDPDSVVRVAQLSDDLFAPETLEKFRSAPITIGHPVEDVNTHNMKDLGKGTLEGAPFQDGMHLASSMVLNDQEAIDLVNSGVTELSVRAYYTLVRVDDNADYDAIRTIKTVNHVAIVERGRAGVTCRISDGEDGEVQEEFVADIAEVPDEADVSQPEEVAEEAQAQEPAVEAPEKAVEASTVEDEQDNILTLKTALSDALERIKVLEAAVLQKMDDKAEEVEEETPMSAVMREAVKLSDQKPVPQVSAADEARQRMINRYKHL